MRERKEQEERSEEQAFAPHVLKSTYVRDNAGKVAEPPRDRQVKLRICTL